MDYGFGNNQDGTYDLFDPLNSYVWRHALNDGYFVYSYIVAPDWTVTNDPLPGLWKIILGDYNDAASGVITYYHPSAPQSLTPPANGWVVYNDVGSGTPGLQPPIVFTGLCPTPTLTVTPTYTPSNNPTPTYTPTNNPTPTPTLTLTQTVTLGTLTPTPTQTFTPTYSNTPYFTPTTTRTPTYTPTQTKTPHNYNEFAVLYETTISSAPIHNNWGKYINLYCQQEIDPYTVIDTTGALQTDRLFVSYDQGIKIYDKFLTNFLLLTTLSSGQIWQEALLNSFATTSGNSVQFYNISVIAR